MANRISGNYPNAWMINLQQTSADFVYFTQQGGWADLYYKGILISNAAADTARKLRTGL